MEDKIISEKESLELISRMIQTTRKNRISATPYLFFGYVAAIGSLIVNALNVFVAQFWCTVLDAVFFIILGLAMWAWFVFGDTQRMAKNNVAVTHFEKMHLASWQFICVCMVIVPVLALEVNLKLDWNYVPLVSSVMQLILASMLVIGGFFSRCILDEKYKVLTWPSSIALGTIMGVVPNINFTDGQSTLLKVAFVYLIAVVVSLIVPGHRIRKENNSNAGEL